MSHTGEAAPNRPAMTPRTLRTFFLPAFALGWAWAS
jgi:hypothetical protein